MYAKIQGSTLVQYPYTYTNFVADNNNTKYPAGIDWVSLFPETAAAQEDYTLSDVQTTAHPTFSADTQTLTQGTPIASGSVWVQTWEVTNKSVAQAQSGRQSTINSAYQSAISSIPVTVNGSNYQLDNSTPTALSNNLQLSMSAFMISSQAPVWASGSTVTAGISTCNLGGVYLYCSTSGKTGSTAPTAPITFGTPVTDGTAAWELLGRKVFLQGGSFVYMTPQQIISAFQQGELYLHQMSDQLVNLTAQINAATTWNAVQAIVW